MQISAPAGIGSARWPDPALHASRGDCQTCTDLARRLPLRAGGVLHLQGCDPSTRLTVACIRCGAVYSQRCF